MELTPELIIKYALVISEFDGWRRADGVVFHNDFNGLGRMEWPDQHIGYKDEFKYHTSWDWIMPVARKCISCYGDMRQEIFDALHKVDLEALFVACYEFIMWAYGEGKEKVAHYVRTGKMLD